jgi:hypothetical protein
MMTHLKQAAFVLAVFAVAKLINKSVAIPVIGDYLPK